MANKLGNNYRNHTVAGPSINRTDVIKGIIGFSETLKNENPDFYKYGLKLKEVDWSNEKNVDFMMDKLLGIMDNIAPEGSDFKQGEDGSWSFVSDVTIEPEPQDPIDGSEDRAFQSEGGNEFTYIPAPVPVSESHIKYIYSETIKNVLKED